MTEAAINDGADETKAEIYEAMAVINRSFAQITTALYKLEAQGVVGDDYSYHQEVVIRELAAKINCHILAKVNERELDDRKHYGKMREGLMRRKSRP
jgi:GMP synthase PP-ATPase subunit